MSIDSMFRTSHTHASIAIRLGWDIDKGLLDQHDGYLVVTNKTLVRI